MNTWIVYQTATIWFVVKKQQVSHWSHRSRWTTGWSIVFVVILPLFEPSHHVRSVNYGQQWITEHITIITFASLLETSFPFLPVVISSKLYSKWKKLKPQPLLLVWPHVAIQSSSSITTTPYICCATLCDGTLHNVLIQLKLGSQNPPGDYWMLHPQQLVSFISLMAFIFLTPAICQAAAARRGIGEGSNPPYAFLGTTGTPVDS